MRLQVGKARRGRAVALLVTLALPAAASAAEHGLEEITVTAEKRGENLQTVPISITAFSATGLQTRGILSTVDLAQFTPGLQFSTNSAYAQPYIRGIGSNQLNVASDPSVAVNLDGIYVARPAGQIQNFLDVERVEVLKGPQGTLYGRNATGGAINIISNAPTRSWTGTARVELGNYDALSGSAAVGGPLVEDRVLMRVAVGRETRDGFYKNVPDDRRLDSLGVTQARGTFDFLLSDTLSVRLAGNWRRERDSRGMSAWVLYPGPATTTYGRPILSGGDRVDNDGPMQANSDSDSAAATIKWQVGDLTATSITGHRHSSFAYKLDLDLTGYRFADNLGQTETSRTTTQEVRLESADTNRFYWTVGGFYLNEKASAYNFYRYYYSNQTIVPQGRAETDAKAVFGQAYFRLTDQIRLIGGARYSTEDRTVDVRSTVNSSITSTYSDKATFHAFTPKFGIDYTPAPGVMLYASATKGFKSGGYNAVSTSNPAFRPEKVWAYEIGAKADLFAKRVRLNAAAFYYDYSDLQVIESVPGLPSRITNAAAATIQGGELSVEAIVTPQLMLNANVSLLDATYDEYRTIDSERPALGVLDLKGNTLPRAPKTTFNIGAVYSWDVPWGQMSLRGDYFHTSKIYFVPFNTPKETEPSYGLVNASLSFAPANSNWSVMAWVRNLTNERYAQLRLSNSGFFGTVGFPGAPQTYGLRADYRF